MDHRPSLLQIRVDVGLAGADGSDEVVDLTVVTVPTRQFHHFAFTPPIEDQFGALSGEVEVRHRRLEGDTVTHLEGVRPIGIPRRFRNHRRRAIPILVSGHQLRAGTTGADRIGRSKGGMNEIHIMNVQVGQCPTRTSLVEIEVLTPPRCGSDSMKKCAGHRSQSTARHRFSQP